LQWHKACDSLPTTGILSPATIKQTRSQTELHITGSRFRQHCLKVKIIKNNILLQHSKDDSALADASLGPGDPNHS